jgi:probable O-glycosylation ligase (exosortase A-associated)
VSENKYAIEESKNKSEFKIIKPTITSKHIGVMLLVFISIIAAAVLLHLPEKYQLSLLFLFPALIVCMYILTDPYVGVYLYFLYEFLRPYDLIPALLPLRLAMVIEIVTLISWVLYLTRTKHKVNWSRFHWAFLAFLTVIAFTVITAANNRYAYNTFQLMMVTFIIFVIATNVVDSTNRLNKLIWLLLLTHFYFALKGIYNYAVAHTVTRGELTSGYVGSGYIGDENDFALALNVMVPFAFFMIIYSGRKIKKFVGAILLITFTFGVVCSFSRGGWLGLVAALVYCILGSTRRFASLGYILLMVVALIALSPSRYWKEVETISDTKEGTAKIRINYWKAALRMYKDHPIIGVGAGNGRIWMPKYATDFKYPATQWGRAFHGTIPQVMAELGSSGLACYLLMLFYIIRYLSRIKQRKVSRGDRDYAQFIATAITGGIISYLVSATFLSTAYYPQLWTLYTLAMILVHCQGSKSCESSENYQKLSPEKGVSLPRESQLGVNY